MPTVPVIHHAPVQDKVVIGVKGMMSSSNVQYQLKD